MAGLVFVGGALAGARKQTDDIAGNICGANVDGLAGIVNNSFARMMTVGGRTVVSGVSATQHHTISIGGEVRASNVATHIAISGGGFIPVASSLAIDAEKLLTRVGDFAPDHNGNLVNSRGFFAMGRRLDDAGKTTGAAGDLSVVNVRGLSGKAKETTRVDFAINLNSDQDVAKGSGRILSIASSDRFNGSISDADVIIPNGDNFNLGDQIQLKVGTDLRTYQFGGVASSFNMSGVTIFGKATATEVFASAAVAGAGVAGEGHGISVKIGNKDAVHLKFVASNPNSANREFNSLSTLKDALNNVPGLTARISNNTLYVAATDGTESVVFQDGGATAFKATLGLTDIPAAPHATNVDARRFSSLGELQKLLRADGLVKVTTPLVGKGLDVAAKDPLQQVTFTAKAERKNAISSVAVTGANVATVDGAKNMAKVTIIAANSGLNAGDYVRLNGLDTQNKGFAANGTPDGIYYVTSANEAGFTVSTTALLDIGGGPAQVDLGQTKRFAADGTWQKTTGHVINDAAYTVVNNLAHTAAIGNGDDQMTINVGAFNAPGHILNGLVNNDMVYISDFGAVTGEEDTVSVPDGYYQVTGVNAVAGTFVITTKALAADGDLAGGVQIGHAFNVARIGASAGGQPHVVQGSQTFINSPTLIDGRVRVFMPGHGYSRTDYVKIGGAAGIDAEVDGKSFEIVDVDPDGNWFEFKTETNAGRNALTALGALPAGNFIDRFSLLDKALSLPSAKDGVALDAAYIPGDAVKGLVSGKIDGTWTQSVVTYDSQGNAHNFNIAFAKIGINKWAVEIYVKPDSEGEYDVVTQKNDGVVKTGTIEFDAHGKVVSFGGDINSAIPMNWKNGAGTSSITFNWGTPANVAFSALTNGGGVRQTNGPNSVSFIDQDGYRPGKFTGLVFDEETGHFVANFDNGQNLHIFELPIGYVADADNLSVLSEGVYRPSHLSGGVLWKASGQEGVGRYISSAREGSNIDTTEQTVDLTKMAMMQKMMSAALQKIQDTETEFLRRM